MRTRLGTLSCRWVRTMFEYVTVHLVLCRLQMVSVVGLALTFFMVMPMFIGATSKPSSNPYVIDESLPKSWIWTMLILDVILFFVFLFYLIFVAPGDCGSCNGF